jgi:Pvc16 N-terminal domain
MSNFLAVATVTAALSQVLLEAVKLDVPGADVSTVRPNGKAAGTLVNIYLYQVTANAALSNADLPARRADGQLLQRPVAALDLNYLLTFFGTEAQLEPQRLLGSVVRTLHSQPLLTRDRIKTTIGLGLFSPFLGESNLADAVELVKFTPLPLSLDELSKLWSVYFQTPYSLSIAYQATVVLIEGEEATRPALPVASRNIYVSTFRQPSIDQVRSAAGVDQPIISLSPIVITGQRLRGAITQVSVSGIDVTPQITSVTDNEIDLTLPAGLRAGVQGLQVIQPALLGTPPTPHAGVRSNLVAFVLHPTIKKSGNVPDITVPAPAIAADGTRSTDVTIKIDPLITKVQRALLFMNEMNPPVNRAARAYSFDSAPHNTPADPDDTDTLVFPIKGVRAGDYLARIQVDGAESPLEQIADPNNPVYAGPKMTIP